MKKRRRILCALMAAMMLLALVPAPVLATGSSPDAPQNEIYLGGEQEASENTNGVTGDAEENLGEITPPAADAPQDYFTEYDLWVGGVRVTSDNMHDVFGDAEENGGTPTVVFSPAAGDKPNTLTLTNANIRGPIKPDNRSYGIESNIGDLRLELAGENTVTGANAYISYGISLNDVKTLTIAEKGVGSLNAYGGEAGRTSIGINAQRLVMESGTVGAYGRKITSTDPAIGWSYGVYACLTMNGGYLLAVGGEGNFSEGIHNFFGTGARHSINGGTVEASGNTRAVGGNNLEWASPDLSGYAEPRVKVSMSTDGADAAAWNGTDTDELTTFKYVKIAPPFVSYDLWVGSVQVTSDNMHDVLGNGGKVRFTPAANGKPHTLTLTNASITGAKDLFDYAWFTGIYGDIDLTLALVGTSSISSSDVSRWFNAGICMLGRELTVTGDGSLNIEALRGTENRGIEAAKVIMQSGTVNVTSADSRTPAGNGSTSHAINAALTVNGGSLTVAAGAAKNGSYGIIGSPIKINGGTVVASGQNCAFNNAPDLSGYGDAYIKVSLSADGANAQEWNGTDALTDFKYVRITPPPVKYDLWVGGVQVTSENMHDVFGDAEENGGTPTVVFSPAAGDKPNTLTLTNASITGARIPVDISWHAGIYGKLDLTLELVGTNTIIADDSSRWFNAGICMLGRELTVTGDGSLRIEARRGIENRGVEVRRLIMQSGTVNVISADSRNVNNTQATSHAVNGALTVNGGSLTATAGAAKNGSYGIIGSPIKINGGTVEASGQNCAFNTAPDLSGYAEREVTVSANADGADAADWNGTDTDELTGFKYVKIAPDTSVKYALLVGSVQVTSKNMHDVFGDAAENGGTPSVKYTPVTERFGKLTLTNANIVGEADFAVAAILAEGVDLELELCGENRIYVPTRAGYIRGICLVAGDLTVSGDGSLDITTGVSDEYDSTAIECEKVTVESGTVRAFGGKLEFGGVSYGVHAGRLVINGGSLTAVGGDAEESFGIVLWEGAETYSYGGKDRDGENIPAGSGLVINGGTLEARGKTAALNNVPDLSGYDEPYVTVSTHMDGYGSAKWNDETELTAFKYVRIAPEPIVEYDLWIAGVRVTEQNMGNILGETKNGTPTASFDPDTNTLTLNDVEITRAGMHTEANFACGIFAVSMELRIEGSGKMSLPDDSHFSILMEDWNGEPSLTLCGDFDFRGGNYGLDVYGDLVFEGGAVKAHNIHGRFVSFRGGTVDAYSNHEAFYAVNGLRGIELDRLLHIELPENGQVVHYDITGYVIEGGESWTEHVRIAPRPPAETEIELSCEPLTCAPGETVTVTLTLREKNGRLIRGAEVELDIDEIGIYTLRTGADGTATISFTAPENAEGVVLKAYYAGDAMYKEAWANAVVYVTSETVTVRLHDPVGVVPEGTSLVVPKGIEGGDIFEVQNEWLVHIGDRAPEMYDFRGWELLEEQPQPERRGEQAMVIKDDEDSWLHRPIMEDIDLVAIWEEYPIIESISLMLDTRIAGLSAAEISAEALLRAHPDAPYYVYTEALYMKPKWLDADGNPFAGVFQVGKAYRVSAWITGKDYAYKFLGWRSGEKLPLYLNGEQKAWDGTNYEYQIYVSVPFTPLPQDHVVAEVDRVEIELLYAEPRMGEPIPVMPNVRVNGAEAIAVNTRMMMEINGDLVTPPANTYGVGRYCAEITLAPNLRCSFAEMVTVDITDMNGESYHAIIKPNPDGTLTVYGQSQEAIELFAIAVRGGTASAARAAAGETVTLTADEEENGYKFIRWQVNYPEALELDDPASPTAGFIMPEGEVSVTAVFAKLGNVTLALPAADEGGAPVEFAVHKILRWKGMDHASTGEPTNQGYDPTDTGSALTVLSGGAPVPYSDEMADLVLELLMNAEYARYTQNGFGTLSLRAVEGEREFVLVEVVNDVETELMSVTVGERGGNVHAEVCSLAPGFVRMTLDGTEYAFATPGDVNLDGEMDANDWANVMRWTLEAIGRFDTKPEDPNYTVSINGNDYNLWILMADMDNKRIDDSADEAQWHDIADANDWRTIMYLTLEVWKE